MNERGERSNAQRVQAPYERRLFIVLLAFGVAALFFGLFQILNTIRSPFRLAQENEQALGPTGSIISSLSKKDTDNDGLSDFDELYRYQTSPYLADSDSDGSSDQTEVFGGTDPNCTQGQTCTPLEAALPFLNTNTALPEGETNTNSPAAANTNTTSGGSGFSLDELRLTLRNAGAPAATLDSISDADLLQLYTDVTGVAPQPSGQSTTNANTGAQTNAAPANTNQQTQPLLDESSLESLTPAQIRTFLIQGGADEATLQEVDDDTLREIYRQALSDLSRSQ
jgi:hypothetical protein